MKRASLEGLALRITDLEKQSEFWENVNRITFYEKNGEQYCDPIEVNHVFKDTSVHQDIEQLTLKVHQQCKDQVQLYLPFK